MFLIFSLYLYLPFSFCLNFSSHSFISCFSLNLFFFLVLSLSPLCFCPLSLSCCLSALLIPTLQVIFLFLFLLFAHVPLSHSSSSCTYIPFPYFCLSFYLLFVVFRLLFHPRHSIPNPMIFHLPPRLRQYL
jgi:hypothetical protein